MADSYPIEKQACLLGQAKELAELLGEHAPESYFGWGLRKRNGEAKIGYKKYLEGMEASHGSITVYRAYTGDELGVLLPSPKTKKDGFYIEIDYPFPYGLDRKFCSSWHFAFEQYARDLSDPDKTEAEAKADLLICLLKKKIIKPEGLAYA